MQEKTKLTKGTSKDKDSEKAFWVHVGTCLDAKPTHIPRCNYEVLLARYNNQMWGSVTLSDKRATGCWEGIVKGDHQRRPDGGHDDLTS